MNPVQFGVFTTPQHSDIERMEHVHAAEAAGFDYVSIQDHPYSPAFLDTLALIGTLIAQTSRLRFMPNVANLPLRPPAMLAKASATLDLLSDGRFELGLGGGRLWPQIVGLGGPNLSPREVVESVGEAITTRRALSTPGPRACSTSSADRPARGSRRHRLRHQTASTGPFRRRARAAGPKIHRHPPRHPARRHRRRARAHHRASARRSGEPADPHDAGSMGTDHHRVRPRGWVIPAVRAAIE
jgi:alkanesulfonate monooxygenase SsuD/methylene tetrahydromethanopterin reductase-like flavin-dependent oxidoreductase (luciferase family)